ncbi:MAG TPA: acyltransferase family protein [Actinomycetota bacterium]|nr:acyltransferase family protein [Actinomycetota bacterium]
MSVETPVSRTSVKDLAAATPASRDRYVDFLRALSIAVVVFGHWLMAIVFYDGSNVSGENALEAIPGMWVLTWVLQVMPVFFFVGGFSNLVSLKAAYAKGSTPGSFVRSRVERLMRPTIVFIGTWMVLAFVLEQVFDLGPAVAHATALIAKPVWFLAVYILVVALAPMMLALHERYGVRVPAAMVAGAMLVDVIRIGGGVELVGYLNFAFVWLFVHQLGFFYADGSLTAFSRRFFAGAAVASVATLVVLTNIGVYSRSMVGVTGDGVSNNDPPSICLIFLTTWLVSVTMLARGRVTAWLQKPRPWTAVIAANSMIMTIFLWHLTALLVAVVTAYPLGFPQHEGGTTEWWLTRPLWLLVLTVALVPLVVVFSKYERPRSTGATGEPQRVSMIIGVALVVVGMAGFAQGGFAGLIGSEGTDLGLFVANPLLSAFHLTVGLVVLGSNRRGPLELASVALVALAALEMIPLAPRIAEIVPVVPGNVMLHLASGLALGLFLRDDRGDRVLARSSTAGSGT